MAVDKHQIQVEWSSANSISVSAGSGQASDAFDFSDTAFQAMVTLKADNGGSPADGDTVDFYLLPSAGDPDAEPDSADEFPADETHGLFLARLDTYTPGEDPAVACVPIPVAAAGKIYAKNNASSNSITVSACINEKTA